MQELSLLAQNMLPKRIQVPYYEELLKPQCAIKKGFSKNSDSPQFKIMRQKQDRKKKYLVLGLSCPEPANVDFVVSRGNQIFRKTLGLKDKEFSTFRLSLGNRNLVKLIKGTGEVKFHLTLKGMGIEHSLFTLEKS